MNMLEFGGGRKRQFNVAHCVKEEGGAILALDVLEEYGQGMDATCPKVIGYLTQHVKDEKIDCTHGAQMCNTWSPSHCLGQDDQPPIGQYRSIGEPQGKSTLSGEREAACRKANIFRSNMLAIGVRLTAKGRSVSLESSPSYADPNSPQYVSYGGYDTSEHVSYFDGMEMAAYIRTTGSVLIIVWRCAATPHESDNGYRKVMAFLVNRVAYERAKILRSLAAKPCKHPSHRRLRGNAPTPARQRRERRIPQPPRGGVPAAHRRGRQADANASGRGGDRRDAGTPAGQGDGQGGARAPEGTPGAGRGGGDPSGRGGQAVGTTRDTSQQGGQAGAAEDAPRQGGTRHARLDRLPGLHSGTHRGRPIRAAGRRRAAGGSHAGRRDQRGAYRGDGGGSDNLADGGTSLGRAAVPLCGDEHAAGHRGARRRALTG